MWLRLLLGPLIAPVSLQNGEVGHSLFWALGCLAQGQIIGEENAPAVGCLGINSLADMMLAMAVFLVMSLQKSPL